MNIVLKAIPASTLGIYALECSECGPLGTFTGTDDELAAYACEHMHTHGMDVRARWII